MGFGARLVVLVCLFGAFATPLQARTQVFNSFGAKFKSSIKGPCVKGPAASNCGTHGWQSVAYGFSPSATGALDHVDIAVGYVSGDRGVVVTLVMDHGGSPSLTDPILESWLLSRQDENTCCSAKLHEVLASNLHPGLAKGSKYWVVVTPIGFDSFGTWQTSPISSDSYDVSADGGTTWQSAKTPPPAMDVWVQ